MGNRTKKLRVVEQAETTLGERIHREVRGAIERAVAEELEAALGAATSGSRQVSGGAIAMGRGLAR